MSDKSGAIVIRQADFSESSRVVTFFTREFGKLAMLAKGGRRQKNPFDDSLDLLATSEIVFIRKQGALSLLTEASLSSRFRPPAANLKSLYAGYYIAETLDALTEEADPHPALFDDAVAALGSLQSTDRVLRTISRFELLLLSEIGQCPPLDQCLACGLEIDANSTDRFVHWVSQGGLLCNDCRVESYASRQLSGSSLLLLKRLADRSDDMSDIGTLSKKQVGEVRSVLNQLVAYNMERKPKMARYLSW